MRANIPLCKSDGLFPPLFLWENAGMKKSGTYVAGNDKATAEYRKTRREKAFFGRKYREEIESIAYS